MKEASSKRPHIIWLHLYEILRTAKSTYTDHRCGFLGFLEGEGKGGGEYGVSISGYSVSLQDGQKLDSRHICTIL